MSDEQTTDGGASYVSVAHTVDVRAPNGTLTSTSYEALYIVELRIRDQHVQEGGGCDMRVGF